MFDGWRVARFSPQGEQRSRRAGPVAGTLSDDGLPARRYENAVYYNYQRKYASAQEVADYPFPALASFPQVAAQDEEKPFY